jgi:hypothetical protein
MAKKRGGLAGLYDRNKGIIQKAAPVLSGMVGGPLAGAAVGAAMRGLDREGKSGIGFDVGQGVRGGMEGAISGAAGKGIKGMFTAGMAKRAALKGAGKALEATKGVADIAIPGVPSGIGGLGSAASAAKSAAGGGFNAGSYMANDLASQVPSRAMQLGKGVSTANPTAGGMMDAAKKAGGYIERNQQMLGGAAKGIAGVLGSRAEGEAAAGRLALDSSKFDYEKQQDTLAQEKRRRLAQLTGQMFAPQLSSATPYAATNQRSVAPQMMDPYYVEGEMAPFAGAGAANMYADPDLSLSEYINSGRGPAQSPGTDYMATGFGGSARARQLAEEAAARGRAYTYGRK